MLSNSEWSLTGASLRASLRASVESATQWTPQRTAVGRCRSARWMLENLFQVLFKMMRRSKHINCDFSVHMFDRANFPQIFVDFRVARYLIQPRRYMCVHTISLLKRRQLSRELRVLRELRRAQVTEPKRSNEHKLRAQAMDLKLRIPSYTSNGHKLGLTEPAKRVI